ncbi:tRNA(adenine34) deaminase [Blastocladiella emersonii ATCC 22665]|nr:tRNA(adenine34) deaminase [Blastocladiella emersonii ATCC 22665]
MAIESEYDEQWMREALRLAQEALDVGEVPVGCVFVHAGEVIGRGRNYTNEFSNASRHAELVALDQIAQRVGLRPSWEWSKSADPAHAGPAAALAALLAATDLYVTVEPCVMCASALRQLGVRRVYFGCGNDRFGGCGSVVPVHSMPTGGGAGPDGQLPELKCASGFLRDEAILMLRQFYLRENESAPKPRKKANRQLKTDDIAVDPAAVLGAAAAAPSGAKQT